MKDETHLMSQPKGDDTWMARTGGFARDKTLRDEFAMRAMQSELASGFHESDFPYCARRAYKLADAMLKAREAK
jgi:hypothetical protein